MAYLNKKLEAQVLLSQDISQVRVAELLKISRKTIGRWMKDPGFKEGIVSGRKAQLEAALSRNLPELSSEDCAIAEQTTRKMTLSERLMSKSFGALDEVLSNPEVRTSDRLKAIEIVLRQMGGGSVANFGVEAVESQGVLPGEIDKLIERRKHIQERQARIMAREAERAEFERAQQNPSES